MWLVRLKLTIVVGRMLLNLKMLSMTLTRSSGSSSTQEGDAAADDDGAGAGEQMMISSSGKRIQRAVKWFSLVWNFSICGAKSRLGDTSSTFLDSRLAGFRDWR